MKAWFTGASARELLVRPHYDRHLQTMELVSLFSMLCLLAISSCVGVIYKNSQKHVAQMDEIVVLLRKLAERPKIE